MQKNNTKFKNTEIGLIPREWNIFSIGQLGKVITGKTPSKNNQDEWGAAFDFITPTDIHLNEKYLSQVSRKISQLGLNRFKKLIVPANSVIVTCIGSDMGKVVMNKNDSITNQQINSIIVNNSFNKDYIYYGLKYLYPILWNHAGGGSTMPIINKSIFESLELAVPNTIIEQNQIAEILSSLDDKIELNRKINENLEKIAGTLFKHWFVDFEFPDKNGKPYKSNGGKMIDSELGPIPEGWRAGKLKDLIVRTGTKFKKQQEWVDKKIIDLSIMPNFSICIEQSSNGNLFSTNINTLKKYDLLFGSIRPYFGKVGFSPIDGGVAGTVYSFLPKDKNFYSFVLLIVSSKRFIEYTVQNSRGTKMPIINWNDMINCAVVMPELNLVADFNNIIFDSIKTIECNIKQDICLTEIRDSILPKLMSGKIRV